MFKTQLSVKFHKLNLFYEEGKVLYNTGESQQFFVITLFYQLKKVYRGTMLY